MCENSPKTRNSTEVDGILVKQAEPADVSSLMKLKYFSSAEIEKHKNVRFTDGGFPSTAAAGRELTLHLDDVQVRPVLHLLPVGVGAVHLWVFLPLLLQLVLQLPDLSQQLLLLLGQLQ